MGKGIGDCLCRRVKRGIAGRGEFDGRRLMGGYTTRRRFSNVPSRDPRFGKLAEEDIGYFESVLGKSNVVRDPAVLDFYNTDWMNKYRGYSSVVLRPKNTDEVSKIVKYASERVLALVPQGGNTGLVGGSVPVHDEIIVSLQRLDRVIDFDNVSGVLRVEAGAILQNVDEYLERYEYAFPLDLGAKGSCQIGGNVATNAGGLKYLRYGSMHANVLGLEVVLADGQILSQLSTLSKNNTGYDLNHLFIGSEGTLGIITAASVKCVPAFKSVNLLFLGVDSYETLQKVFLRTKLELGEILSAFEFMDNESLDVVFKTHPDKFRRHPLEAPSPFYILIETRGSNFAHDREKVDSFLDGVGELISDGIVAQDLSQQEELWSLRENITESLGKFGKVYKYDLSIPLQKMYGIVEELRDRLRDPSDVIISGFGHVGDCNIHLNVCDPNRSDGILELIEPFVYEYVSRHGGSISAEHGLGIMKPNFLKYSKSQLSIDLMQKLKECLDPQGILNPYKLLPHN